MILISEITKHKTGFNVLLSTGETLKISEATKLEFLLYAGKELDEATLFALEDYEVTAKAYTYLLMLVSRGSYSCKMVSDKLLKKGYSVEVADRLIKRAIESGLLNDAEYARSRLNYLVDRKKASLKGIIHDLKAKGISEFTISDLLYELPDFQKDTLKSRYQKLTRKYQKLDHKMRKEKIKAKLYSEGFPLSLIKEVIAEDEFNEDSYKSAALKDENGQ